MFIHEIQKRSITYNLCDVIRSEWPWSRFKVSNHCQISTFLVELVLLGTLPPLHITLLLSVTFYPRFSLISLLAHCILQHDKINLSSGDLFEIKIVNNRSFGSLNLYIHSFNHNYDTSWSFKLWNCFCMNVLKYWC